MLENLRRIREEKAAQDGGFTLIELLVVVVIIGILVAIAIPLYLNYRKGAENKSAESDVRGAISAVEQFYTSNGNAYPTGNVSGTKGTALVLGTGTNSQTISVGSNNTVNYSQSGDGYKVCGLNDNGKHLFVYDSVTGGAVQDMGEKALNATCTVAAG